MKERPIIFNAEMVRAILDGRKTQTRRPVKLYEGMFVTERGRRHIGCVEMKDGVGPWWKPHGGHPGEPLPKEEINKACPFGQPGDRLWVRETWSHTGAGVWRVRDVYSAMDGKIVYKADDPSGQWFPSIHMPRWASRITLEITGVRVERVQEISEDAIYAEGTQEYASAWADRNNGDKFISIRHAFKDLWNSIYAEQGLGWDANSWVWVIEFKRIGEG